MHSSATPLDPSISLTEHLTAEGLSEYLPIIRGGNAIHLNRTQLLRELVNRGDLGLRDGLRNLGITREPDLERIAALLQQCLETNAPLHPPKAVPESAASETESWARGVADADDDLASNIANAEPEVAEESSGSKSEGNAAVEEWPAGMQIVNDHLAISIREQGLIREPNPYGYIHLAAEVESPHLLRHDSAAKRELLKALKIAAEKLAMEPGVRRADLFSATIIPPGSEEGRELLASMHAPVHIAAFDVVLLVECTDPETAEVVRQTDAFGAVFGLLDEKAQTLHCIVARNAKRIDEVDKTRDGVFLFNYFHVLPPATEVDPTELMLGVWEYTAGWWTAKANLTNSTPLEALPGQHSEYTLINHCRWDKAMDVLPSLLFRPSLNDFVLRNFTVNGIVAMPVLYHLV